MATKRLYAVVGFNPKRVLYIREFVGILLHGVFTIKSEDGMTTYAEDLEHFGETPEDAIKKFRKGLERHLRESRRSFLTADRQVKKMKAWTKKGLKIRVIPNT